MVIDEIRTAKSAPIISSTEVVNSYAALKDILSGGHFADVYPKKKITHFTPSTLSIIGRYHQTADHLCLLYSENQRKFASLLHGSVSINRTQLGGRPRISAGTFHVACPCWHANSNEYKF